MDAPERVEAYVGLGANVGDRITALQKAVAAMERWPETEVVAASSVYETEAHVLPGSGPQPDHLNAVVHVRTALDPLDLLRHLHEAERAAGRDPEAPAWSPRPLDLDLLLYGAQVWITDELAIPHPRLTDRRFVLQPLADVAPHRVLPGSERTVSELLEATPDRSRIVRTNYTLRPNDPSRL